MAKLPYGGLDIENPASNAPWLNLLNIAHALENNEPLNPELARWLGEAILRADKDEKKLLINLGLAEPKGKPSPYDKDAWLIYGSQLYGLEYYEGLTKEQAIESVQKQLADLGKKEIPRQTLQKWREIYINAKDPAT